MKIFKKLNIGFLFIVSLAMTGCSTDSGDVIEVSGSTSVAPLMEELIHAYEREHGNIRINMNVDGSTTGIRAAAEQVSDIGMTSRDLRDDELEFGLEDYRIAKDAIAVVVHPGNPVASLSSEQLYQIFSGEITNWQEVGGIDLPIVIVSREDSSGTIGAFEDALGLIDEETGISVVQNTIPVIVNSNGAMIENVMQRVGAIGYVSAGSLRNIDLKVLEIDGYLPTFENIIAETYLIVRTFDIVALEPNEQTRAFIEWILSEEGQAIVENEGYTSVKRQN
jgi:phosphate transport system substrate-binding protein